MVAPRPPGERPRTGVLPLDVTLAACGAVLAAVALVRRYLPNVALRTFDRDPGVRALGIAFAVLAVMLWSSARLTSTGTRRLAGRIAAVACAFAAAVRLAGPFAVDRANALLPDAAYAGSFAAAVALLATSAFVYATSPARRAKRRSRS